MSQIVAEKEVPLSDVIRFLQIKMQKNLQPQLGPASSIGKASAYDASDPSWITDEASFAPKQATSILRIS